MNKRIHLTLTLVLSFLFLSRAAIDFDKWELFAEDTKALSVRGQNMGKLRASGPVQGYLLQILNPTSQTWLDRSNGVLKLMFGKNEEVFSKSTGIYWAPTEPGYGHSFLGVTSLTEFCFHENYDNYFWINGVPIGVPSSPAVFRYDRELNEFTAMGLSGAKSISLEPDSGKPWAVIANGDIHRYLAGLRWTKKPGKANSIVLGATNEPYIVSQEVTPEGFAIKKWNGETESWETIPGIGGVFITLDEHDNLYVITNDNKVYRQKGVPSIFCPMCRENCQTAECTNYEGYCSPARDQCLSCPPGSFVADSPLRCQPCPAHCPECSSLTTCKACPPNFYLTPNGTCLASCDFPLVVSTEGGKQMCKGPCATESADIFYYSTDESCRPTCEVPIVDSSAIYQSCEPCPDNCLTCSSATNCSQCSSTHFLTPRGTCRSSCPAPLVSLQDNDGNLHCEGPCADQATDIHYYPSDGSCRSACDIPVSTCSITTF